MTPSIRGGYLPDSEDDFKALQHAKAAKALSCFACGQPFTSEDVQTSAGWRETQISAMCEICFTKLFHEDAQDSGVDTL